MARSIWLDPGWSIEPDIGPGIHMQNLEKLKQLIERAVPVKELFIYFNAVSLAAKGP